LHFDGNGNVCNLTDASTGKLSAEYEYNAFGELLRTDGAMSKLNPFRFSTKYQDDESGFNYYGYRYYNASTGRWLSREPLGEAESVNLYTFCSNEAISALDYLGLNQLGTIPGENIPQENNQQQSNGFYNRGDFTKWYLKKLGLYDYFAKKYQLAERFKDHQKYYQVYKWFQKYPTARYSPPSGVRMYSPGAVPPSEVVITLEKPFWTSVEDAGVRTAFSNAGATFSNEPATPSEDPMTGVRPRDNPSGTKYNSSKELARAVYEPMQYKNPRMNASGGLIQSMSDFDAFQKGWSQNSTVKFHGECDGKSWYLEASSSGIMWHQSAVFLLRAWYEGNKLPVPAAVSR
jgi:RHS repeat-associated protein